ncbi:hypothetical protein QYF36_015553 [Acer negundo]|nr:hypothetical protein QYF36_015553 [Acer negundo]
MRRDGEVGKGIHHASSPLSNQNVAGLSKGSVGGGVHAMARFGEEVNWTQGTGLDQTGKQTGLLRQEDRVCVPLEDKVEDNNMGHINMVMEKGYPGNGLSKVGMQDLLANKQGGKESG